MSQELFIASGSRRDYLSGIMLLTTVGLGAGALYFWSKLDSFKNFFEQERASADKKIKKLEETIEKQAKTQESLQNELISEKSKNAELQKNIDKLQTEKNSISTLESKLQSLEAKFNEAKEAKKVITPVEEVKNKQTQLRGRASSMGSSASFYKATLPKIPEKENSPQKSSEKKTENTRLTRSASTSSCIPVMRARDQGILTSESEQIRLASVTSAARATAINRTKKYIDEHGENTEAMDILEELLCGHNDSFTTTYKKIEQKSFSTVGELLERINQCAINSDDIPKWKGMREGLAKERIASVIKNNLYLKVNERTKQYFASDNNIKEKSADEKPTPSPLSLRNSH